MTNVVRGASGDYSAKVPPHYLGQVLDAHEYGALEGDWKELRLNPFAFFKAERLCAVVSRSFERLRKSKALGPDARFTLNYLLRVTHDENDAMAAAGLCVLNERDVLQCGATDALFIATLRLTPTREAIVAHDLRTLEYPIGAAAHVGRAPLDAKLLAKKLGKSEQARRRALSLSADEVQAYEQDAELFNEHKVLDSLVHACKMRVTRPVTYAMYRDEVCAALDERERLSAEEAERAATVAEESALRQQHIDSSDSSESELDGLEPFDSDDEESDDVVERDKLVVPDVDRREWLRCALKLDSCAVDIVFRGPWSPKEVLEHSRLWSLSADSGAAAELDEPLGVGEHDSDAGDAVQHTLLLFSSTLADAARERPVRVPEPAIAERPVASEPLGDDSVASDSELSESVSEPVHAPAAPGAVDEPLNALEQFAAIDFASLTIYELETYATRRLQVLCSIFAEAAGKVGDVNSADVRAARLYPKKSGADLRLLEVLGADAVRREAQHEAIGAGALALVAHGNVDFREFLLCAEVLLLERELGDAEQIDSNLYLGEYSGGVTDAQRAACCDALQDFWRRSEAPDLQADTTVSGVLHAVAERWAQWAQLHSGVLCSSDTSE